MYGRGGGGGGGDHLEAIENPGNYNNLDIGGLHVNPCPPFWGGI